MTPKVIFWAWFLATDPFHIHVRATPPAPSGQVVDVDTGILGTPDAETRNTTGGGQGDGFLVLKGRDAFAGENYDVLYDGEWQQNMPCNTDEELSRCKLACKDTVGVEAFTVFEGTAYFRGKPWEECEDNQKNVPGAILYLYTRAPVTKAVDDGFLVLEGKDAFAGENHDVFFDGQQELTLPCNSVYDLQRCKMALKDTPGVEAFIVFEGTAYFRGRPWKDCQDNQKDVPGATLYLYTKAPVAAHTPPKVSTVPAAVVQPRSSSAA